ncbi:MAG: sigma-54 dependent transcriptional regulator [Planctomycetes bacterium]|nr:sigma-54 dependent transcriptional regulator [Planctomycetota bacterium]
MARARSVLDVLVVDDDPGVRDAVSGALARQGHSVRLAGTLAHARRECAQASPDAVFLDLRLPDGDGMDLLAEVRQRAPHVEVVVITGFGDVDLAVRALRLGAKDLLEKPFTNEQIAAAVQDMVGLATVVRRGEEPGPARAPQLIGASPALVAVCREIQLVARTPATTVLLLGESGTGKELAARAIHGTSDRARGPFVAVNCAALTETLLEAELFGYEKGAFTGASSDGKPGLFETADGGTILLDEVGEMDLGLQAKLLRVLQERAVKRVGGLKERPIDVRVVASTHRDLAALVEGGRFREDLYYRLTVMPITMPPLRERAGDVELLAHYYLKTIASELGRNGITGFELDVLERLRAHPWPGNVRELRNVVERAVIVARGPLVRLEDLALGGRPGGTGRTAAGRPASTAAVVLELPDMRLETAERALVTRAMEAARGQKTRAAELLGINRATLYNKLKLYGLAGAEGEPQA